MTRFKRLPAYQRAVMVYHASKRTAHLEVCHRCLVAADRVLRMTALPAAQVPAAVHPATAAATSATLP